MENEFSKGHGSYDMYKGHPPMNHGSYNSMKSPWVMGSYDSMQSPWVMGSYDSMKSPWVMGRTMVGTICNLHGSWVVRQYEIPMGHWSYDSMQSPWVMDCVMVYSFSSWV